MSSSSSLCLLPRLPDIMHYYVYFIMCLTFNTAHMLFHPLATEHEREKQKYFLIGPSLEPPHLSAIMFVTKTEGWLIRDLICIWFMMKGTSENLQLHSEMVEILPWNWFSSSGLPWTVNACSYSPEISFSFILFTKACPWTMSCDSLTWMSFTLLLIHGIFHTLLHIPPISVTILNLQTITQSAHAQACRTITFWIHLQC